MSSSAWACGAPLRARSQRRVRAPYGERAARHVRPRASKDKGKGDGLILNPLELGRRSRALLDNVWSRITNLTGSRASFTLDDDLGADTVSEGSFSSPQAEFTNVLVVGGTGKLGRIVVRKLLLRGYTVRVLCRDTDGLASSTLPSGVEIVRGNVGVLEDCQKAVEGMDKIVYCAASSVAFTAEYTRTESTGVSYIARSWLDSKYRAARRAKTYSDAVKNMLAHFADPATQDQWDVLFCGPVDPREVSYRGKDTANCLISEDGKRLAFIGSMYSESGVAEWGGPVSGLGYREGLLLCALADGNPYSVVLVDDEDHTYIASFGTRFGYNSIRLTWNMFQQELTAERPEPVPLRPEMISLIKFRFDRRMAPADEHYDDEGYGDEGGEQSEAEAFWSTEAQQELEFRKGFEFEIHYIKALPVREEPTFVLVSCAGDADEWAMETDPAMASRLKRIQIKRKGEMALRLSGVGYMIMRPGLMVQEPGGYRAMIFDQGERIQAGIGYADVADVALRALHEPQAVNKTFELCYEPQADEALASYELVAHMPSKATNYLEPALAPLIRNT